jgi:hypothetical protein
MKDIITTYKNFEAVIINKPPVEDKKPPEQYFTKHEIDSLMNNEGYPFRMEGKQKALSITGRYRISVYKIGKDVFTYRVRDMKDLGYTIIYNDTSNTLRDCLYNIDEFLWNRIREDKAREKAWEEDRKKPKEIFSGKAFTGRGYINEFFNFKKKAKLVLSDNPADPYGEETWGDTASFNIYTMFMGNPYYRMHVYPERNVNFNDDIKKMLIGKNVYFIEMKETRKWMGGELGWKKVPVKAKIAKIVNKAGMYDFPNLVFIDDKGKEYIPSMTDEITVCD